MRADHPSTTGAIDYASDHGGDPCIAYAHRLAAAADLALRTIVGAMLLTGSLAMAQEAPAPQVPGSSDRDGQSSTQMSARQHRGPPPEALAACSGSQANAPCSFSSPNGEVQGSCWAPQGKPLACRPRNGSTGQGRAGQGGQGGEPPRD